jgi:hypothetical protein
MSVVVPADNKHTAIDSTKREDMCEYAGLAHVFFYVSEEPVKESSPCTSV